MENLSSGATDNFTAEKCWLGKSQSVILSLINILTFLIVEPVIVKMLWIIFTSRKTIDILNCNLALFHSVQYLMSFIHLIFLFLLPNYHTKVLKALLMYTQTGGPMSLSFICLERYVAVIHPTSYRLLNKYRCKEICALTVWLFSALAVVIIYSMEHISHSLKIFFSSLPLYVMVFMTAMMTYCTISILRALKKSAPGRDKLHPAKKRTFKTIRYTSVINLCCYIPVSLMERLMYVTESRYDCIIVPMCMIFLSAASVVHPLFYLSNQGKLCTCLKGEKKPG